MQSKTIPSGLCGIGCPCVHAQCLARPLQELLGAPVACMLHLKTVKATAKGSHLLTCLAVFPALRLIICIRLENRVAKAPRQAGGKQARCVSVPHAAWLSHGIPAAAPEPARTRWKP